jgi:hypothetical protein
MYPRTRLIKKIKNFKNEKLNMQHKAPTVSTQDWN